jgi:hypothetical protein
MPDFLMALKLQIAVDVRTAVRTKVSLLFRFESPGEVAVSQRDVSRK